jgi:hypothetical protein
MSGLLFDGFPLREKDRCNPIRGFQGTNENFSRIHRRQLPQDENLQKAIFDFDVLASLARLGIGARRCAFCQS